MLRYARWFESIQLRFLEAGEGVTDVGFVHAKTIPFGIMTQATVGAYRCEHSGAGVDGPPGTVMVTPPRTPVAFTHRLDPVQGVMRYRFAHVRFLLGGGLDLFTLLRLPRAIDGDGGRELGESIETLLGLRDADPVMPALALRQEIGYRMLRLVVERSELEPGAERVLAESELLAPVLQQLQSRFAEDWDVGRIAALARVSRATLHRRFLAGVGVSPMEYLKRLRLDEAASRLMTSTETLASLAEAVGFATPFHLSREFAVRFGASPSEFRKDRTYRATRPPPRNDPPHGP